MGESNSGGEAVLERSVWKRKVNIFLLFIPLVFLATQEGIKTSLEEFLHGMGLESEQSAALVFSSAILVLAALSLIPLAGFLESAVEELAELLGEFLGGLLHTTASNVAELALALSVLTSFAGSRGSEIVLSSVAGVIVRNALLFLGIATLLGCWRNGKMRFSPEAAGEYSTVFALAVTGLSLPTLAAFIAGASAGAEGGGEGGESAAEGLLIFGHVPFAVCIAIVLLVSYVAYLVFVVFKPRTGYNMAGKRGKKASAEDSSILVAPDTQALFEEERASAESKLSARAQLAAEKRAAREESGEQRFLGEHRVARGLLALLILGVAAAGVVMMSEHFADSVKEMIETNATLGDYEFFLGLILIPVLAGVVELYGSVGMARRKKMDITMAITAGASIQMILLVVPILVLVGWLTGHPLGLVFTPLNVIVFGASTFAFMLLSRDGESTMLEGVQLVALWLLLAVVALFLHP